MLNNLITKKDDKLKLVEMNIKMEIEKKQLKSEREKMKLITKITSKL